MGRPRFATFALALAALTIGLAAGTSGCKPKPGGSCRAGAQACENAETELFCLDGKYAEMSCGGPAGCVKTGQAAVECDNTLANVGDGCADQDDLACTTDKKNELRCRTNKFAVASTCRGPTGCFFTGNKLHCDTDIADLADPCEDKDDLACSLDKKALYKCDGAKYAVESTCRGPKGCRIDGSSVHCDHHLAETNDPCFVEGNYACTADRKALLLCKGKKFVKDKPCKSSCTFTEKGDTTEFDCP